MSGYLSVGEAAKRIGRGATPRDITGLFYLGRLRDDLCPMVGGRRLIPETYVEVIADALARAGKLKPVVTGGGKW